MLGNDFGPAGLTAELSGTPAGRHVALEPSRRVRSSPRPPVTAVRRASGTSRSYRDRSQNAATVTFMVNCLPNAVADIGDGARRQRPDHDHGARQRHRSGSARADSTVVGVYAGRQRHRGDRPGGTWRHLSAERELLRHRQLHLHGRGRARRPRDRHGRRHRHAGQRRARASRRAPNQTAHRGRGAADGRAWATALSRRTGQRNRPDAELHRDQRQHRACSRRSRRSAPTARSPTRRRANANGSATVTVRLSDNGGVGQRRRQHERRADVHHHGDARSTTRRRFIKGADESLSEDTGAQTVAGLGHGDQRGSGGRSRARR